MKITLLRHCAVESAYDGCYNGHIDISLSKQGYSHAKQLAIELQHHNFDALFCSDLKRAKETLDALDISVKPKYSLLLREKSWGRHEGLSFEKINETIPYENFAQWLEALDGERVEEFIKRIKHFFFELLPQHKINHALIITHAGVIKTLMTLTNNLSLQEAFAMPFPYGSYTTTSSDTYQFKELLCD